VLLERAPLRKSGRWVLEEAASDRAVENGADHRNRTGELLTANRGVAALTCAPGFVETREVH
jgi:hypothetical protein